MSESSVADRITQLEENILVAEDMFPEAVGSMQRELDELRERETSK